MHGGVSRHTRARAEHLGLVAEGLCSKTKLLALSRTVEADPALAGALRAYEKALQERLREAKGEERKVREHVEAFGKGGKAMRELARRYGEILAETEETKSEIARLEQK